MRRAGSHLYVACSAVEVHVEVFDFSIFAELVHEVLLGGLFMYAGNKDDPSFDR